LHVEAQASNRIKFWSSTDRQLTTGGMSAFLILFGDLNTFHVYGSKICSFHKNIQNWKYNKIFFDSDELANNCWVFEIRSGESETLVRILNRCGKL